VTDPLSRPAYRPGGAVGARPGRAKVNGVLLLHYDPNLANASNVVEHTRSFGRYSRFRVWALNTQTPMPKALARYDFEAIVFHYSLFGAHPGPGGDPFLGTPYYLLDEGHLEFIGTSSAYKIAFFQDEHTYCTARFRFCDEVGIDCVYTCLEPTEHERVWGTYTDVAEVRTTLPGYVDDRVAAAAARHSKPEAERSVDVGYRARPMPIFMDTGQEKTEIGRGFAELASGSGLRLDIGLEESDRIYGQAWHRFIADCRTMLGVESGVSIFDVEDQVRRDYVRILREKGEVTVADLRRGAAGELDGAIPYRTISPRHFEAAAFGVCQVLFPGRYSGAMEPMEHYIPLEKDFSNLDDVVAMIRDPGLTAEIAARARRDLIDSGEWGYERFIEGFDLTLLGAGLDPRLPRARAFAVTRASRRGRLIAAVRGRSRVAAGRAVERTYAGLSRTRPGAALLRALARARRRPSTL
jgi:hypothetical protein